MKKVLFVASVNYHLTLFHIPYMQYLQTLGYEVWAASEGEKKHINTLEKYGIKFIRVPFKRNPVALKNLKAYSEMKLLLKQHDFDLIHVHTPVASLITRIAFRKIKKGKIIYTAHGFHFYKKAPLINWLLYFPTEYFLRNYTDFLITINKEDYNQAIKMGFNKTSTYYVPGVGVEENDELLNYLEKNELKKSLNINKNSIIISYIAELNDNKNHFFLLDNWAEIKKKCPQAVLLIIGEGLNRQEIENFILKNNLNGVYLLGQRNDIWNILGITDIASLLSYREGLPKSIMEAMVKSIPCIVSNTRGLRDLITHDVNGYVINHSDNENLVKYFTKLLKDDNLRKFMGEKSQEEIRPYLLKNVIELYKEIYNKALFID